MSSRLLNILVLLVCGLWAALFTYTEIIMEDPDQYSIRSPRVRQELANCTGTFQERQQCAEKIVESQQQIGFLVWCEKLIIILGPPLILYGLTAYATRQRRVQGEDRPVTRRAGADGLPRRMGGETTPRRPAPRIEPDIDGPFGGSSEPEPLHPSSTSGAPPPIISGGRREPVRRR